MDEKKIHAVTVAHNTGGLLADAVCTLKKWHPLLSITIVDGSDNTPPGRDCQTAIRALVQSYNGVDAVFMGRNIGHGDGMHYGIMKAGKENVLVFDTDVIVKKPVLQIFGNDKYYAMGMMVYVDKSGHNQPTGIKYIHPYFALISRPEYLKFPKFRNAGAPCLYAMKAINHYNPAHLIDVDVARYVVHLERGTRAILKPEEKYYSTHHPGQHGLQRPVVPMHVRGL